MIQHVGTISTEAAPLVAKLTLATAAAAADDGDAADQFSQNTLQETRAPGESNLAYIVGQNWQLAVAFAVGFTVIILVAALWIMAKARSDQGEGDNNQRRDMMTGAPRDSM